MLQSKLGYIVDCTAKQTDMENLYSTSKKLFEKQNTLVHNHSLILLNKQLVSKQYRARPILSSKPQLRLKPKQSRKEAYRFDEKRFFIL